MGSCSGTFYAFDRRTGEIRWSYDTRQDGPPVTFHGDPLVTERLVIVGADLPNQVVHLYAFEQATGEVRWKVPFHGGVPVDVLGKGGKVYVATSQGEAVALELETGHLLWHFDGESGGGVLVLHPVLAGGRFVFAVRDGQVVFALNADTGELLWKRNLGARPNTSLATLGGQLYIGGTDGRIHRFTLETGEPLPTLQVGGLPYGNLVPAEGCLLVLWREGGAEDPGEPGPDAHVLACLEPESGQVRWRRTSDHQWSAFRPLVRDGLVLAGNSEGQLLTLRLADGALVWSRELKGTLRGLGGDKDLLVVGTLQGTVYALPLDGTSGLGCVGWRWPAAPGV